MESLFLISFRKSVFVMLSAVGLSILMPSLWAQQDHTAASSPGVAWSSIQQLVKELETAVQSKNLHGIHEPSMKIRAPIRALKQYSSMLSADASKKIIAELRQLDELGFARLAAEPGVVAMRLEHQQAGEPAHPVDVGESLLLSGFGHCVRVAQESPTRERKSSSYPNGGALQKNPERDRNLAHVATEFSGASRH